MAAESFRERTGNRSLVLFDSGDQVTVQVGEEGCSSQDCNRARELREGTFIKSD